MLAADSASIFGAEFPHAKKVNFLIVWEVFPRSEEEEVAPSIRAMNERAGGMSEQLKDFFKHWVSVGEFVNIDKIIIMTVAQLLIQNIVFFLWKYFRTIFCSNKSSPTQISPRQHGSKTWRRVSAVIRRKSLSSPESWSMNGSTALTWRVCSKRRTTWKMSSKVSLRMRRKWVFLCVDLCDVMEFLI